jgi:hypothetical protein
MVKDGLLADAIMPPDDRAALILSGERIGRR